MHKSKSLLILMLLVAFVGQTMAYTFVVPHDEQSTESQLQSSDIHVNSAVESENSDDCCDVECCDGDCICPANTCASMAYMHSSLLTTDLLLTRQSHFLSSIKDTHDLAKTLYRPPIYTS